MKVHEKKDKRVGECVNFNSHLTSVFYYTSGSRHPDQHPISEEVSDTMLIFLGTMNEVFMKIK